MKNVFLFLLLFITANVEGEDTATVNALYLKGTKVLNPDSAIVLFDSMYMMSVRTGYADGAFMALVTKGIKYLEKLDYESYRRVTYDAMPWAEKSTQKDAVAWCLINIGEAWFNEGNYTLANEFYYEALKDIRKKTTEITHATANIYNCLGMVNTRLQQYDKALGYYNLAYHVSQQANLPYQLAIACENKGKYFIRMGMPDSAEIYFRQEMDIGKQLGKVDLISFSWGRLGEVSLLRRQYKLTVEQLHMCIEMAQNHFTPPVIDAAYSLAEAYTHMGIFAKAKQHLEWAYMETKQRHYRDHLPVAYRQYVALYKAMGDFQKALLYTDSLLRINDTLINADKVNAINHLEIKYRTSEKDLQLAESRFLLEKQESTLARKTLLIWMVSGGGLLLAGLLIISYRNGNNKQRLQNEKIKSLRQQNTIDTLNARMDGEEKERARIARELHDGIGGMLSSAIMQLSTLPRGWPAIKEQVAYTESISLLKDMGAEVRKTSHNLMPDALMKQTLDASLQALCQSVKGDGAFIISYQSYGDHSNLSAEMKLNLYRIVQELLHNAVRHAQADKVLIQTTVHDGHITLTVEDDGSGFDKSEKMTGLGLSNVAARVRGLNGDMVLNTAPGMGTAINIDININIL